MEFDEWISAAVELGYLSVVDTKYHNHDTITTPYHIGIGYGKKYRDKQVNATAKGLVLNMTFMEYMYKIWEAGITSPEEIGNGMTKYQLGRIGDSGDYTVQTCRFITGRDNVNEKIMNGGYSVAAAKTTGRTKHNHNGRKAAALKMSNGYYITPIGTYYSAQDAASANGCSRNRLVNWCVNNTMELKAYALSRIGLPLTLAGMTPKELGWYFVHK